MRKRISVQSPRRQWRERLDERHRETSRSHELVRGAGGGGGGGGEGERMISTAYASAGYIYILFLNLAQKSISVNAVIR